MNEKKLKQLFDAARQDAAPAAPADFAADVLRAVYRAPPPMPAEASSVLEQLNGWFPRVGLAAAAIIVLCVAADWSLTAAGLPGVGEGAAQATSQYLFNSSADDL
jgi:anti-sigma-K factor RskA